MTDPLGAVSSIITIFELAKSISHSIKDAKGLPQAFKKIESQMDLVESILKEIKRQQGSQSSIETIKEAAFHGVANDCAADLNELKFIYEKVSENIQADWRRRYKEYVFGALRNRKGKVEVIWKRVLEAVNLMANMLEVFKSTNASVPSANEIAAAITEIQDVEDSLAEPSTGAPSFYGPVAGVHTGVGENNSKFQINHGSGVQYQDGTHTHTHHHGQGKRAAEPWTVPRGVSRLYTGRQEIGQALSRALLRQDEEASTGQRRFVIYGLGGTGKSEVCIKFAHDHRKRYAGVFWIDCKNESTAGHGFERAGRVCGLTEVDVTSVTTWLSSTGERWLLVIDNADNAKFDYAVYFPSGQECSIIITTRNPDSWKKYSTVGHEDLDQLGPRLATDLLLRAAERQPTEGRERRAAEHIVEALGRHTLAILHAGAYISQSCEVDEYLELYRRQKDRWFKNEREQDYSEYGTVHATFEMSVKYLEDLQSKGHEDAGDALNLLNLLAFTHYEGQFELILSRAAEHALFLQQGGETVGGELRPLLSKSHATQVPQYSPREGAEGRLRWRRAYQKLRAFSLISTKDGVGDSTLSMHSLVHQWALERQDPLSRKHAWWQASSVLALSCRGARAYIPVYEIVRSHVRACLSHQIGLYVEGKPGLDIASLLSQLARVQFIMYDYGGLREILKAARAHLKESENQNTVYKATLELETYILEGGLLGRAGNSEEAVKLLEHAISVGEVLDERHPSWLLSQYELAIAYNSNHQFNNAIEILEHVVSVNGEVLDEEHQDRLASQHELARAYLSSGKISEAIKIHEHVVSVSEKTQDERHPDRLESQHALAIAYRESGKIDEAVKILEHVVSIRKKTLDERHPNRLASQHELARAYRSNGQFDKAVKILEYVVSVDETLDETYPSRLASQHELAIAYRSSGKINEAIKILEHVVSVERRTLDERHPDRLASQHALALAYRSRDGTVDGSS